MVCFDNSVVPFCACASVSQPVAIAPANEREDDLIKVLRSISMILIINVSSMYERIK
jgi:hypothetical protein